MVQVHYGPLRKPGIGLLMGAYPLGAGRVMPSLPLLETRAGYQSGWDRVLEPFEQVSSVLAGTSRPSA